MKEQPPAGLTLSVLEDPPPLSPLLPFPFFSPISWEPLSSPTLEPIALPLPRGTLFNRKKKTKSSLFSLTLGPSISFCHPFSTTLERYGEPDILNRKSLRVSVWQLHLKHKLKEILWIQGRECEKQSEGKKGMLCHSLCYSEKTSEASRMCICACVLSGRVYI